MRKSLLGVGGSGVVQGQCLLSGGLEGCYRCEIIHIRELHCYTLALDGLVVACLPLDQRFVGSNPAKEDGFLRVIKICSTTSFGGEEKPSMPCHKILQHVEEPYKYERDTL
jgi:hypothetical protein